jgi:superkiller protein 3
VFYGALLLMLGVLTWKQCRIYADSETLWRATIERNPASWLAQNNLGDILLRERQFDGAIVHFRKAIAIDPDYAEAFNNLGNALLQMGQTDEAIAQFQHALVIQPDIAVTRNNLGTAFLKKGKVAEAITQYQLAIKIQPDNAEAMNNLATALLQKGEAEAAMAQSREALKIRPDYANAHKNLGAALFQNGQVDEAINQFQRALSIQPGLVEAQNDLAHIAWVLATSPAPSMRNGTKAVELAQQTNQLSGGKKPMLAATLAAAYAEAGRFPEAIACAGRAVQLASSQNNTAMVAALEAQLKLYQAGSPFRDTGVSH